MSITQHVHHVPDEPAVIDNLYVVMGEVDDTEGLVSWNQRHLMSWREEEELRAIARHIVASIGAKLRLVRFVRAEVVEEGYGTR